MADFTSDNTPIQASRKRIVALSKCTVDGLAIKSESRFSGTAVLVTVFTLSAHYQYHLVFLDNSYQSVEIWHFDTPMASHSGVQEIEKDIRATLQKLGIKVVPLAPGNVEFQTTLARVPVAFDDDNVTPVTGFTVKKTSGSGSAGKGDALSADKVPGISKEAKKALSDLFIQF
ncbi:MAG: hypothetical protein IJU23_03560 [Proteobacteria bacterium]|nr:hypothetical protein [Pseudomonadota bacterium]